MAASEHDLKEQYSRRFANEAMVGSGAIRAISIATEQPQNTGHFSQFHLVHRSEIGGMSAAHDPDSRHMRESPPPDKIIKKSPRVQSAFAKRRAGSSEL